uniref:Uncharacterized protein n=1 Tax=Anguilla anguilla TaxID=7936 RepID=A0A0E9RWM5_ANGAN
MRSKTSPYKKSFPTTLLIPKNIKHTLDAPAVFTAQLCNHCAVKRCIVGTADLVINDYHVNLYLSDCIF